jgi:hypothetical protein
MKIETNFISVVILALALTSQVFANTSPVVSNVTVSQRTDGSGIVDISYMLCDADNDLCDVSVLVSNDGGSTWTVSAVSFTGDIGSNIKPGAGKHITWNCKTDLPEAYGTNYRVKLTATNEQNCEGYMSLPSCASCSNTVRQVCIWYSDGYHILVPGIAGGGLGYTTDCQGRTVQGVFVYDGMLSFLGEYWHVLNTSLLKYVDY